MAPRATRFALILVCVLALAGCGDEPTEQASRLPAALADRLADRADRVAAGLEAGEPCAALAEAGRLRVDAETAIADGRIPAAARVPLEEAVASLAAAIVCEPEPPPAVPQQDIEEDEEEDKPGKSKGHGNRDDDEKGKGDRD